MAEKARRTCVRSRKGGNEHQKLKTRQWEQTILHLLSQSCRLPSNGNEAEAVAVSKEPERGRAMGEWDLSKISD
eukprot:812207-Rhodomonas_salina.2